jgi:hypothetical protein
MSPLLVVGCLLFSATELTWHSSLTLNWAQLTLELTRAFVKYVFVKFLFIKFLLIKFLLINFLLIKFLLINFLLIKFWLIKFLLIKFLLIKFLLIKFLLIKFLFVKYVFMKYMYICVCKRTQLSDFSQFIFKNIGKHIANLFKRNANAFLAWIAVSKSLFFKAEIWAKKS